MACGSACSYHECSQGLLDAGRAVTKAQKNHVSGYHTDHPIALIYRCTNRTATFKRQTSKIMDFVCHCGSTFTLDSSLQRHYQLCMVARDIALQSLLTTTHVNAPAPREGSAEVPHTSRPGSRTPHTTPLITRVVVDGRTIKFLEAFTGYMITQITKSISLMTEHRTTFLQALTSAQAQQNIELQRALAEHREAFEQLRSHLDNQRQA
ncbi:hypothetical protein EDD21DRAFT_384942 [Dissophora ornata]|nr:hypothetical protein EDD21DRAFT_384942 [Dissophora ornata]